MKKVLESLSDWRERRREGKDRKQQEKIARMAAARRQEPSAAERSTRLSGMGDSSSVERRGLRKR